MSRNLLLPAFAAAVLAVAPGTASAQNQTDADQITATAVVAAAINVAAVSDLDFGTVMPSFGRTIAFTDGGAGHFQVTGAAAAEVTLEFTVLPTDLSDGVNLLPVVFTALFNTAANPSAGTSFDPATTIPTTTLDATTGEVHVYVGGTVTAAGNQVAGTYSAQVELTAAYTGN
jgi:hypothetical protein